MNDELIQQLKAARRVSVPLVAITTPDSPATIAAIKAAFSKGAILAWDVVEGVTHVNDEGKEVRAAIIGELDPTLGNPVEIFRKARELPPMSILCIHLANRWVNDPMVVQSILNLRDAFKTDSRMIILLGVSIDLPPELVGDVIVFDEPLPDAKSIETIVRRLHSEADVQLDDAAIDKSVEAMTGLPAFQAEQVAAMSLRKAGMDHDALWERKRKQIEQTPGLKVFRDGTRFDDIGGVPVVKGFLKRILQGNARPNAIVFVDEIEKFLAGASGGAADSSGVSQDQLGQLLSYMQDKNAAGCIFVGPPGAAKSAVAKSVGNEAGIPTIQLDLGAMKGSLVGQSEQSLRAALKVITSVSNGRSLWISTCNAIADLPPELRRRFTLGTYFFDLPDRTEREAIWAIWLKRYGLATKNDILSRGRDSVAGIVSLPDDEGWTGAEIRQCCEIAWRLGCTLKEAAGFVVPVSRSAADQLERLRKAAEGRFLSASKPGVYTRETPKPANGTRRRQLQLEDAE